MTNDELLPEYRFDYQKAKPNRFAIESKPPKKIEPLPEEFASKEEAGEFWDEHSTMDYAEHLKPVDLEIDLQKRRIEPKL